LGRRALHVNLAGEETKLAKNSGRVPAGILKRAKRIRLFLMDVDGTLTDGGVCLISSMASGELSEMKTFDAHDGAGLTLAHIMGIKTGVITGRNSAATAQRAKEMKMDYVFQGRAKKIEAYEECQRLSGATDDETAYLGDDLPDIPLLNRAGLALATSNAMPEVKQAAHFVTRAGGGHGAAREVVEMILRAQGRWSEAVPRALA
jgi:3-deoxy-D-manno-octulosonate 8-phosphate phosphatase (KDO 8-P phosphatase)